jgi:hypothetical protein
MRIIGLDYHPSFQQIAFVDTEKGECGERRLAHANQEAERFYRELKEYVTAANPSATARGATFPNISRTQLPYGESRRTLPW